MPVLREYDVGELASEFVDDRDNLIGMGNSQSSPGAEIVLDIDDEKHALTGRAEASGLCTGSRGWSSHCFVLGDRYDTLRHYAQQNNGKWIETESVKRQSSPDLLWRSNHAAKLRCRR